MELFLDGFNGGTLSAWLTAVGFMLFPVGALMYWMYEAGRLSAKSARKDKKDLNKNE